MVDLHFIENARWNCPRCKTTNTVCIEKVTPERVKCLTCQVYFHRKNKGKKFVSADNKHIYISES